MKVSADLYDTIEFVAEAYGGIGQGMYFNGTSQDMTADPCCAIGIVIFAKDLTLIAVYTDEHVRELERVIGISGIESDDTVAAYSYEHGTARMPFHLWAPAVGLERGE